jgi:HPt (histidine-containing phosphotransfer) domain-containing protein
LGENLNNFSVTEISNIDKLLEQALDTLQNIGKPYQERIGTKQEIISSIFPEKLNLMENIIEPLEFAQ